MQRHIDKMVRPIYERLSISSQAIKWRKVEKKKPIVLTNFKEEKSAIPSRIKRQVTLEGPIGRVLKANTYIVITTTL